MSDETKGRVEPVACYTTGGRWSPNEDRPMHGTLHGDTTLCGLREIEVFRDPEPVPFAETGHQCQRCAKSLAKLETDHG